MELIEKPIPPAEFKMAFWWPLDAASIRPGVPSNPGTAFSQLHYSPASRIGNVGFCEPPAGSAVTAKPFAAMPF